MSTFGTWLKAQGERQDETGELARKWASDPHHGNISTPTGVSRYIGKAWPDQAEQLRGWLSAAVEEYNAGRAPAASSADSQPMLDVLLKRAREQSAQLAWLQAAVSFLLPDDVLKKLNDQEADSGLAWDGEAVPVDFGALLALADFTAAEGAGDA